MLSTNAHHYWVERIHKNEVKILVVHPVDLKETMDELYVEACQELKCSIPDDLCYHFETWKNISKWRDTIKFEVSECFTEQEMIEKGLIDDPSKIQLDEKVWGSVFEGSV